MDSIGGNFNIRGAVKENRSKIGIKPDESSAAEPSDSFKSAEITRDERIQNFLEKAQLKLCEGASSASMALVGAVTAGAVALATVGGHIPVVISVASGAGAGMIMNSLGWDKKVGKAINKSIQFALTPVAFAAKHIKSAFSKAIDMIKPGKNKDGAESSPHGQGESKPASVMNEAEKLAQGLGAGAKAVRSAPDFLYPQILNATDAERAMITGTLDVLPLSDVVSTKTITVNPTLAKDMQASGLARDLLFDRPIDLDRGYAAIEGFNTEVLIHEIGHTTDFAQIPGPMIGRSQLPPFGKEPYVFDSSIDVIGEAPYAATNAAEDFAQTYQMYHTRPDELKTQVPVKYEAMENFHKPTLYDKVMDRSGIRKAGREIAAAIDKIPGLRTAMNITSAVIGPITARIGAEELKNGIMEKDPEKKFKGKMDLAQGVLYSSRFLSPLGIGITGAKWILGRRVKKGDMSIETAEKIASGFLASSTGPLGLIFLAASNEMVDPDKISDGFKAADRIRKPEAGSGRKTRKERKAEIKRLKNEDPYKLTGSDKKFIAKVGAGATIAGVAGTVGGYLGGGLAGAVIGGIIGGPFGAALLGFTGKMAGALVGSYQSARVGAKLAKKIGDGKEKPVAQEIKKPLETKTDSQIDTKPTN